MIKKKGLFFLSILVFVFSMHFAANTFAESYIEGGNEIIKKICDDITALKKDYGELKSFDNASLNKSRRDELYITYGEPAKSAGKKETVYVYISYSKLPMHPKCILFAEIRPFCGLLPERERQVKRRIT